MECSKTIAVVVLRKGSASRWAVVTADSLDGGAENAPALLAAAAALSPDRAPSLLMSWRPGFDRTVLAERAEKIGAGYAFKTLRSAMLYLQDLGMRVYL